jgi:sigma-B regulation protein RsbQ
MRGNSELCRPYEGISVVLCGESLPKILKNFGCHADFMRGSTGNPDQPHLARELSDSFCRMDPQIAKEFARVTFTSDTRTELSHVTRPALVLQCSEDVIAPVQAGAYVHQSLPVSTMKILKATGHCPHLSAPDEVVGAIRAFT